MTAAPDAPDGEADVPDAPAPRISVILPIRDGEKYVAGAIAGILRQTWRDLELIVIDDNSLDRTAAFLAQIHDCRLRVFAGPGIGITAALNHGISLARGEIVVRVDVDDLAHPDRVRQQVEFLDAHPNVVAVGSSYEVIDGSNFTQRTEVALSSNADLRREMYVRNPLGHGTVALRSAALRTLGGYNTSYPHAEDYDLWRRLSTIGDLAALPEMLYAWRTNPASVSSKNAADQIMSARAIRNEIWSHPPEVVDARHIQESRRRYATSPSNSAELVDRFLQMQLAIAAQFFRRRMIGKGFRQIGEFLRHDWRSLSALGWFIASGGRFTTMSVVTSRVRRRRTLTRIVSTTSIEVSE